MNTSEREIVGKKGRETSHMQSVNISCTLKNKASLRSCGVGLIRHVSLV